jgi:sugar phosphate isomerase/epimerase
MVEKEVQMDNKFGVCEWYLATRGPSAIKTASLIGFDGVQISDIGGAAQNFPLNDERIQALYAEAVAEYGVEIVGFQGNVSMTQHGGVKYPMDSPRGAEALFNFKKGLEVCVALKIPTYLICSFAESNFSNAYEQKNTAAMLKKFVELASEEGVQIAYECFCPLEKLYAILDSVGPGLKLCYDTLNPIRFGNGNPPDEIRRLDVDLIDHIHVKDAPENLVGCWPLGQGAGKVEETIRALKEKDYRGWYFIENYFYLPPMNGLGKGWDLAANDLRYLKGAVGA